MQLGACKLKLQKGDMDAYKYVYMVLWWGAEYSFHDIIWCKASHSHNCNNLLLGMPRNQLDMPASVLRFWTAMKIDVIGKKLTTSADCLMFVVCYCTVTYHWCTLLSISVALQECAHTRSLPLTPPHQTLTAPPIFLHFSAKKVLHTTHYSAIKWSFFSFLLLSLSQITSYGILYE